MQVTKEMVSEYCDIVEEIEALERKLHMPATDFVTGSSPEFPYTEQRIKVKGINASFEDKDRLSLLKEQKQAVEEFCRKLPSSRKRRVVSSVMQYGTRWKEVAADLGYAYSEQSARSIFNRLF